MERRYVRPEVKAFAGAISFAAGLACSQYVDAAMLVIVACLAGAVGVQVFRKMPVFNVIAVFCLFVLGVLRSSVAMDIPQNDVSRFYWLVRSFSGYIASDLDIRQDRMSFTVDVDEVTLEEEKVKAGGKVLVTVYADEDGSLPEVRYGQKVELDGRPNPPRGPTNPYAFDYRKYLAKNGTYLVSYIRDHDRIKLTDGYRGGVLQSAAHSVRRYAERAIFAVHPEKESSVIAGMLLGTYAYLPEETMDHFVKSGTLHLLAASGFNCAVLAGVAVYALGMFRLRPGVRHIVALGLLVFYLFVVGVKPSLFRATVMTAVYLIALPLGRPSHTKIAFYVSALFILMVRPQDLFDVGFQLSFAAVWALIYIYPTLARLTGLKNPFARNRDSEVVTPPVPLHYRAFYLVVDTMLATASVTLVVAPVVAYYFNYFSVVSLPANAAVVLFVPVVFVEGIAACVFAYVPVLGDVVGVVGTLAARIIVICADLFGGWKYASLSVGSPPVISIVGYYMVLYGVLRIARKRLSGKNK